MVTGSASTAGIPVSAPEAPLLYKSHQPRTKDQRDFDVVIEHLLTEQRQWRHDALRVVELDHPWRERL